MKIIYKKLFGLIILTVILLYSFSESINISVNASYTGGYGNSGLLFSMTYEEKKKQSEDLIKELNEDKKASESKLADLKKSAKDLDEYIKDLDTQMMDNDLYMDKTRMKIAAKEQELNETRQLLAETKELEKNQYETMCSRIQYMYENGNITFMDMIVNSDSLADFLNQAEYFSKITEYDNNLFYSYVETKQLAEETEAIIELDLASLEELYTALELNQQSLLDLIEEKNSKMLEYTSLMGMEQELLENYIDDIFSANRDLEDIIAEEEERIRKEEEERKKAEEELRKREEDNRLNAALNVGQSDYSSLDGIIWPLPGDDRIFSRFGARAAPTKGASTYHKGVDIGGAYGASIVAALAGTVETVSYSTTGGNYIIINHGDGLRTSYLHCSKQLVTVGTYVKQGEVIALVGSTGVSTGPHLHFSISINGTYVDPLNYISYN